MTEQTERDKQLENYHAIHVYRDVINAAVKAMGLTQKEAFVDGGVSLFSLTLKPRSFYTLQNDCNYYLNLIKNARHDLQAVSTQPFLNRHQNECRATFNRVWEARYNTPRSPRVTCSVIPAPQFAEEIEKAPERKKAMVTYGYAMHVDKMGLYEWCRVGGKEMMFVHCQERMSASWADAQGIQVRKTVMMEVKKDGFHYHPDVWLLTMKTTDGSVVHSANKNWQRARSLMEQYIKSAVMDELEEAL